MDTPEPKLVLVSELPEPTTQTIACESCQAAIRYLRVTTPEGMPDFIHPLDDYTWLGWTLAEDGKLALVATCSRLCLSEWWSSLLTADA